MSTVQCVGLDLYTGLKYFSRPVERGRGKVFPDPAAFGGLTVAQKYGKRCSRWLLSDLKYA